jgi:hypothetical protein
LKTHPATAKKHPAAAHRPGRGINFCRLTRNARRYGPATAHNYPERSPMDTTNMENQFQLAFIDLAFQIVGLIMNIIIGIFQGFSTEIFSGLFGALSGGTT